MSNDAEGPPRMTASQSSAGVGLMGCPFCGGGQIAIANDENKEWHASTWWAVCEADQCGATGPAVHDGSEEWVKEADLTPEECTALAIAAWNRRAALRTPATTGEGEVERVARAAYVAVWNATHDSPLRRTFDELTWTERDYWKRMAAKEIAALPPSSGCVFRDLNVPPPSHEGV